MPVSFMQMALMQYTGFLLKCSLCYDIIFDTLCYCDVIDDIIAILKKKEENEKQHDQQRLAAWQGLLPYLTAWQPHSM